LIRIGSQYVWLLVAIEPKNKQILHIDISFDRTMLIVSERFIASLINIYGKYPVSTDGGTWYPPQPCKFLKLKHNTHSSLKKSLIERTMQYIKNRTEGFDDHFPCKRKKCKLNHVKKWLNLFAYHYNKVKSA
jgi:putative transposase